MQMNCNLFNSILHKSTQWTCWNAFVDINWYGVHWNLETWLYTMRLSVELMIKAVVSYTAYLNSLTCVVLWSAFSHNCIKLHLFGNDKHNLMLLRHFCDFGAVIWVPSVLWCCWLGSRRASGLKITEGWGTGLVFCLEWGADYLHMVQLMPLSPHLLLQWNPEWFTFLMPAYPGWPVKKAVKRL